MSFMFSNVTDYPRWLIMWLIAFAIYSTCKLLTLRGVAVNGASTSRTFAYLMFWPGMCARRFLDCNAKVRTPDVARWIKAIFRLSLGVVLLWVVVRRIPIADDLLRGWIGMFGIILLLHFGMFDLLALSFQTAKIDAQPLMNEPLLAQSVAEFWSKRWNVAFNQLAHRFVFRRVVGKVGITGAILLTFGCSGVVHDLVISVPAGGGYGLPTAYFVFQGLAVLLERSNFGRRIHLQHGFRGRLFTMLVTAGPAFWLFHPIFVRNVMLPFLHVIGCI